jgi:hypothetical protein
MVTICTTYFDVKQQAFFVHTVDLGVKNGANNKILFLYTALTGFIFRMYFDCVFCEIWTKEWCAI